MSREPLSRERREAIREALERVEAHQKWRPWPLGDEPRGWLSIRAKLVDKLDPPTIRSLLAAAERVAALEGLLREVCVTLGRCRDLFSDIRGDWTDPRTECREGWRVIDEAIAAIEAALRAENGGEK